MESEKIKEFDKIYKESVDDIYRYLSFRLNDKEKVLDITQETFVRLWNSYFRLGKEVENVRALIYKIAHNLLVNSYERDKKNDSLDEMNERGEDVQDSSLDIELETEKNILSTNIDKMDPTYKEVIHLRYIEGLGVNEIADILEESQNVISVRIHRGIAKLKEIYGE